MLLIAHFHLTHISAEQAVGPSVTADPQSRGFNGVCLCHQDLKGNGGHCVQAKQRINIMNPPGMKGFSLDSNRSDKNKKQQHLSEVWSAEMNASVSKGLFF